MTARTAVGPHRMLAITAAVLGVLALLAGSPYGGGGDLARVAAEAGSGGAAVHAVDVARRIRAQAPIVLVDTRDSAAYDAYHLPTARHIPLDRLAAEPFAANARIVVYGRDDAHAAMAWTLLRASGVRDVRYLAGGVEAWVVFVMEPMLPDGASEDEEAAFDEIAALSRYFGGQPRRGMNPQIVAARMAGLGGVAGAPSVADGVAAREAALRRVRRGCGF